MIIYSDKSNLKKKGCSFSSEFRVQSVIAEKSGQQEFEEAGHVTADHKTCTVKRRRQEYMLAHSSVSPLTQSPESQPREVPRAGLFTSINAIKKFPQECPWTSSFCRDNIYITPLCCWICLILLLCWSHPLNPLFESSRLGTKIFCIDLKALLISHWKCRQKVEHDKIDSRKSRLGSACSCLFRNDCF